MLDGILREQRHVTGKAGQRIHRRTHLRQQIAQDSDALLVIDDILGAQGVVQQAFGVGSNLFSHRLEQLTPGVRIGQLLQLQDIGKASFIIRQRRLFDLVFFLGFAPLQFLFIGLLFLCGGHCVGPFDGVDGLQRFIISAGLQVRFQRCF